MSNVPEMERFVEHLIAPGWEIAVGQAFGPHESKIIWGDSHANATRFDRAESCSGFGDDFGWVRSVHDARYRAAVARDPAWLLAPVWRALAARTH